MCVGYKSIVGVNQMVVLLAGLEYKGTSARESNSFFGITTRHKFILVCVTLRNTE